MANTDTDNSGTHDAAHANWIREDGHCAYCRVAVLLAHMTGEQLPSAVGMGLETDIVPRTNAQLAQALVPAYEVGRMPPQENNVISIRARHVETMGHIGENLRCQCGSEWWYTAVVFGSQVGGMRKVTGWAVSGEGSPVCASCGKAASPC